MRTSILSAFTLATLFAFPAAADSTQIFVGGNAGWAPNGGNHEIHVQTAGPESISRVLTSPFGSADAMARGAAGVAGAKVSGQFQTPGLLTYGFSPTLRSTVRADVTIAGPAAPVPISVNVSLKGLGSINCVNMTGCSAYYDLSVLRGATGARLIGDHASVSSNTFTGLTIQTGQNFSIQGNSTVPLGTVSGGTTFTVTLSLGIGLHNLASGAPSTSTFNMDFSDGIRYANGLVFNLPAGYTATTVHVQNNAFLDPFAPPGISIVGTAASEVVCPAGLVNVAGDVTITGNNAATSIRCGQVVNVGGAVTVTDNPAAVGIDIGDLVNVGGNVTIATNGAATGISISELNEVGGNLTIATNGAATGISISELNEVGGNLTIATNGAATGIDISDLINVGGAIDVSGNGPCTHVLLGPLVTVGTVNVESCGTGVFQSGTGSPNGNLTVSASGYSGVTGMTAQGTTTVRHSTGQAAMQVQLPAGAFTSAANYTITQLTGAELLPQAGMGAVSVDPIAAYQFTFSVPVLNSPATLSFMVNVAGMDAASQAAFLAALNAGNVTITTKSGAPGSTYQAFPICAPGVTPTVGGCVQVQLLDANGQPATGAPAFVQFSNVVGGFSIWAVSIVTPCGSSYAINPGSQNFTSAGGAGNVAVSALTGCAWTAGSTVSWVSVTGGASASGNGGVSYTVAANTGAARSGTITIAGLVFSVNQEAAPVQTAADLAIGNIALPLVRTGHKLTYLIGAANLGPGTASNVAITDQLAPGTTFVRAFFKQVGCTRVGTAFSCAPPTSGTPCALSGNKVTCNVGTLAPLAPGSLVGVGMLVEVDVTAPAGETLRNVATVSSSNPDPNAANNSNGATTRVTR